MSAKRCEQCGEKFDAKDNETMCNNCDPKTSFASVSAPVDLPATNRDPVLTLLGEILKSNLRMEAASAARDEKIDAMLAQILPATLLAAKTLQNADAIFPAKGKENENDPS